MLELAFSWLASRPQVSSVIAGATRVEQVEQNVKAIGWTLSAEEIAEIDKITKWASGQPELETGCISCDDAQCHRRSRRSDPGFALRE